MEIIKTVKGDDMTAIAEKKTSAEETVVGDSKPQDTKATEPKASKASKAKTPETADAPKVEGEPEVVTEASTNNEPKKKEFFFKRVSWKTAGKRTAYAAGAVVLVALGYGIKSRMED